MKTQYKVLVPEEFKVVISDLLELATELNLKTLVIALQGDLGAGKTAFTQELAKVLGVKEIVTSPTFTIMKQYDLSCSKFDKLVHIDAYRFEDEGEAVPLGLTELFKRPQTVVCVEWSELIPNIIPDDAVRVMIEIKEGEERLVTISTEAMG